MVLHRQQSAADLFGPLRVNQDDDRTFTLGRLPDDQELSTMRLSDDEIRKYRFPGGKYTIAYWENYLLTDCTTSEQLPDGLVHPVALFHVPILGAQIDIATLFAVCGADGAGSVGLDGYDWELFEQLRIETEYDVQGSIVHWEHEVDADGRPFDSMKFSIEIRDASSPERLVARVTNSWRFRRSSDAASFIPPPTTYPVDKLESEHRLPEFVVESVDAQRMKTMAAILRDPYQVHWDREATTRMGLGGRVINQGPLNLSYIINALHEFTGVSAIRRLTVAFHRPVFDGDYVVAGGYVEETSRAHDSSPKRVRVWLERRKPTGSEVVVSGTAIVSH